jgi:hypothetical protein
MNLVEPILNLSVVQEKISLGLVLLDSGSYNTETRAVIIIIIITMAQQPYMGLGLLFPMLLSRVHSWQLVTGQLAALLFLMCPPEPSGRQSGDLGEKFSLRNIFIHARKVLLLPLRRKLCYGFLSPLKIHRPRSGSNPRTLGPPRATMSTICRRK